MEIILINVIRRNEGRWGDKAWPEVRSYHKHMWPSGLRRQTQDLLGVTPHEFESRRVQIFYAAGIDHILTFILIIKITTIMVENQVITRKLTPAESSRLQSLQAVR